MARYSERNRQPVDEVVARWRDECLIEDGSLLFEGEHIWTAESAQELVERFNERPLEDDRSFEETRGGLGTGS
jgi:5-methylcytosine-specific restriction protein B